MLNLISMMLLMEVCLQSVKLAQNHPRFYKGMLKLFVFSVIKRD